MNRGTLFISFIVLLSPLLLCPYTSLESVTSLLSLHAHMLYVHIYYIHIQPLNPFSIVHVYMCSGLSIWNWLSHQGAHSWVRFFPFSFKIYFYHKINIMCICLCEYVTGIGVASRPVLTDTWELELQTIMRCLM